MNNELVYVADSTDRSTESKATTRSSISRSTDSYGSTSSVGGQIMTVNFSIDEIYKATSNFAIENKIGEGGFGTVYKGKLKNGSIAAIKRAKKVGD